METPKYGYDDLIRFTKEELSAIVSAHDKKTIKDLSEDKQMSALAVYAMDKEFVSNARLYLKNNMPT